MGSETCRGDGVNRFLLAIFSLLILLPAGCWTTTDLNTRYGNSTGRDGRQSINGFGFLRSAFDGSGWKTRSLRRVNERSSGMDAIVWVPVDGTFISRQETAWFEEWLDLGGRTLVYVVYDGGSEADYYRNAIKLAPVSQRMEYRRRAARHQVRRAEFRLQSEQETSNGWFRLKKQPAGQPVHEVRQAAPPGAARKHAQRRGELTDGGNANQAVDQWSGGDIRLQFQLFAGRQQQPKSRDGRLDSTFNQSSAAVPQAERAKLKFQPLLTADAGQVVLAEVTSDSWNDSRILVVNGGGLVNNYGVSTVPGQTVAQQVLASCGTPGSVGFLISDESGVSIQQPGEQANRRTGMEFLTTWPLSLVMIHLMLLGIVTCFILWPIFGRARAPRPGSQSDFADHLEAIARLMQAAPDDRWARTKISEYMRRVRGETSGPWVIKEPPASTIQPTEPPVATAAKHIEE